MSTVEHVAAKILLPPLVAGEQLEQPTFHERYEAMPPDTPAELVGGVVYMPSPMRFDDGNTGRIVAWWMGQYQWKTPGVTGGDGVTIKLDLHGEPQPDHVLRIPAELGGQTRVDDQGYLTGAPEMVVEVARSSRSYDLNQKKADYERVRVREYVVVELKPDCVHWFIRRGKRFQVLRPDRGGIYRSEVFPGLWLDAQALYRRYNDLARPSSAASSPACGAVPGRGQESRRQRHMKCESECRARRRHCRE
jgi:Uma2 family endonuclease